MDAAHLEKLHDGQRATVVHGICLPDGGIGGPPLIIARAASRRLVDVLPARCHRDGQAGADAREECRTAHSIGCDSDHRWQPADETRTP